jgi:hypothetical protein
LNPLLKTVTVLTLGFEYDFGLVPFNSVDMVFFENIMPNDYHIGRYRWGRRIDFF